MNFYQKPPKIVWGLKIESKLRRRAREIQFPVSRKELIERYGLKNAEHVIAFIRKTKKLWLAGGIYVDEIRMAEL